MPNPYPVSYPVSEKYQGKTLPRPTAIFYLVTSGTSRTAVVDLVQNVQVVQPLRSVQGVKPKASVKKRLPGTVAVIFIGSSKQRSDLDFACSITSSKREKGTGYFFIESCLFVRSGRCREFPRGQQAATPSTSLTAATAAPRFFTNHRIKKRFWKEAIE